MKKQNCSKNTTKWKIKRTLNAAEKSDQVSNLKYTLSKGSRKALATFDKGTTWQDKLNAKVSIAGRFFTQTKRTQKVLHFDSVGHLGDKSTFTSLCYTAKDAADLWKGIDCIRQIMRLRWPILIQALIYTTWPQAYGHALPVHRCCPLLRS